MVGSIVPLSDTSISEAVEVIRKGGLVVYPTDTVYGIGCDPFAETAIARLFEAKRRSAKPVPVLCDSIRSAESLGNLSVTALSLARRFWPGALTIVVLARRRFPFLVDQGSGEVGLRVPALDSCVKLIGMCGGFLTGTSANVTGHPSCLTAAEAFETLGGSVDMILDGGRREGKESTVVRVRGSSIEVLREGSVALKGHHWPGRDFH
jgi:L-threonylcarbamoyladenylate synthase